jgi:ATP synthase proteolipid subunit
MGASMCMILSSWGSAWGTWRAGLGVCHMGIDHPAGIIKNIVPIVMAGVLGIYGLIVSVIITQAIIPPTQSDSSNTYSSYNGYTHVRIYKFCTLCFSPLACIESHSIIENNSHEILTISFFPSYDSWQLVYVVDYHV